MTKKSPATNKATPVKKASTPVKMPTTAAVSAAASPSQQELDILRSQLSGLVNTKVASSKNSPVRGPLMSVMKCAIVRGHDEMTGFLVWFSTNRGDDGKSWACKVMYDLVRVEHRFGDFLLALRPHRRRAVNGIPFLNRDNYAVRVYVFPFKTSTLTVDTAFQLAKVIKTDVDKAPQLSEHRIILDRETFMENENAVYSDIIRSDDAVALAIQIAGTPDIPRDWATQEQLMAYTFFRSGEFTMEAARRLGAPLDEVSEAEKADAANAVIDEGA